MVVGNEAGASGKPPTRSKKEERAGGFQRSGRTLVSLIKAPTDSGFFALAHRLHNIRFFAISIS